MKEERELSMIRKRKVWSTKEALKDLYDGTESSMIRQLEQFFMKEISRREFMTAMAVFMIR